MALLWYMGIGLNFTNSPALGSDCSRFEDKDAKEPALIPEAISLPDPWAGQVGDVQHVDAVQLAAVSERVSC